MKKVLVIFLFLFLLALPLIVFAQNMCNPATEAICYLLNMVKWIVVAIGLGLAIIVIVIGGIQYATAGSNMEKAANSRKLMINGIIGIAIVFAAAFFITLIQGILIGGGLGAYLSLNPCEVCGYIIP